MRNNKIKSRFQSIEGIADIATINAYIPFVVHPLRDSSGAKFKHQLIRVGLSRTIGFSGSTAIGTVGLGVVEVPSKLLK